MNIERPTSNAEIASLRLSTKTVPGPWLPPVKEDLKNIKSDSMPYSKFEVGRSMFGVHWSEFYSRILDPLEPFVLNPLSPSMAIKI